MKRLIVAIAFAIVLVSLCVVGYATVASKMQDFNKTIETIEKDKNLNYMKAEELEKNFHKSETILSLFINHGKLDELKLSIAEIRSYSKNNEPTLINVSCAKTQMIISDIIDDQGFSMHSLF